MYNNSDYLGEILAITSASSGACYVLGCNIFFIVSGLRFIAIRYPFKRVSNKTIQIALFIALMLAICEGVIGFLNITLPQTLSMIIVYISWWFVLAFGEMILMAVINVCLFDIWKNVNAK